MLESVRNSIETFLKTAEGNTCRETEKLLLEARISFSVDINEEEIRENLAKLHSDSEILIAVTDVNLHITGRVQFRTGTTFCL